MKKKRNHRKWKGTAACVAMVLIFFYAACLDGIAEAYSTRTLIISGLIVMAIAGVLIWYSNLPERRG